MDILLLKKKKFIVYLKCKYNWTSWVVVFFNVTVLRGEVTIMQSLRLRQGQPQSSKDHRWER